MPITYIGHTSKLDKHLLKGSFIQSAQQLYHDINTGNDDVMLRLVVTL